MSNKEKNSNPFQKEEEKEEIKIESEEKEEEISKEEKLQNELDDLNNKYLRLAADFDNYRKRQAQERENLIKYGAEETLKKLIPILDTIKRAGDSIEKTEDINSVKESHSICVKQFMEILEKIGMKKIEAAGKEFDINFMEAVMQTPTNDYPTHTVIAELQTGYTLFDRVLRPAMVNVATEEWRDNGLLWNLRRG